MHIVKEYLEANFPKGSYSTGPYSICLIKGVVECLDGLHKKIDEAKLVRDVCYNFTDSILISFVH